MSPATEKSKHLATVRFWASRVQEAQLKGASSETYSQRLEQAMRKAHERGWYSAAIGAKERGRNKATKERLDRGRPFSSLSIGDTFDFIDPNPEWITANSFFQVCTKTGARSYSYVQGGKVLRNSVGRIGVKVFHVLKKSRIANDPRRGRRRSRR